MEEINDMPWGLEYVINSVKRRILRCRDEDGDNITQLI